MGFGGPVESDKCVKWLAIAANEGSRPAKQALPLVAEAFDVKIDDRVDIPKADLPLLMLSSPSEDRGNTLSLEIIEEQGDAGWTVLQAAEACRYDIIELLLSQGIKPEV